jgi:hypothetical protein
LLAVWCRTRLSRVVAAAGLEVEESMAAALVSPTEEAAPCMQVASALRDAAMGIDRFRVVQSPAPRFGGARTELRLVAVFTGELRMEQPLSAQRQLARPTITATTIIAAIMTPTATTFALVNIRISNAEIERTTAR